MTSNVASLSMPASSSRLERTSPPNSQAASTTASRRTSMLPPNMPASAYSTNRNSFVAAEGEYTTVPMRHPRPLTAAELYLECEKEQEAVVNRLTRELTALRAQTASVASNASHSSTSSQSILPVDISDPNPTHQMTGATHPTPSRRARSSSSMSGRSATIPTVSPILPNISTSAANAATSTQLHSAHSPSLALSGVSQASMDRAMAAPDPSRTPLSRQPSITASGRSTPARPSLDNMRAGGFRSSRPSFSSSTTRDPTQLPLDASSHAYRSEMEIVKAENDALRQRVRALERALRARRRDSSLSSVDAGRQAELRQMDLSNGGVGGVAGPRERSESQSTTASSHLLGTSAQRESSSRRPMPSTTTTTTTAPGVVPGVTDEDLRVGESAASSMGRS